MDAHAWAEVYFKGVGWIPFDATNGGAGGGPGGDSGEETGEGADDAASNGQPGATVSPLDDPSRPADGVDDGGLNDNTQQEPTPTPEANPFDEPESDPQDDTRDDSEFPPEDAPDETPENGARRGVPWAVLLILLVLLLIALAVLWVRNRLMQADPALLCRRTKRASQGAMIAYRANLTLLAHMGQYPQNNESPEAFAQRVSKELDNPDYAAFVHSVTLGRYGGRPIKRADVEAGLRAYERFGKGMGRMERARFLLTRIFRGLGEFEQIP